MLHSLRSIINDFSMLYRFRTPINHSYFLQSYTISKVEIVTSFSFITPTKKSLFIQQIVIRSYQAIHLLLNPCPGHIIILTYGTFDACILTELTFCYPSASDILIMNQNLKCPFSATQRATNQNQQSPFSHPTDAFKVAIKKSACCQTSFYPKR